MRARTLCLLTLLLLLAGGLICEPTPTPTPVPITPTPTRVRAPTPTSTATPTPQPPVTLRWNLDGDPGTLDPAHARSDAQVDATRQLFLGLTAYHPRTSEPIPDLAIHWAAGEGGRVYTFYLRRNVQWVQRDPGTGRVTVLRPVTAHDVVYSLRRAVTHSDAAYVLDVIQNARAIMTTSDDAEALGVVALDDYTVQFTLERPAAYLPAVLAHPVARPVPREVVEAHGDQWTEPQHVVTNGPYTLAQWDHEKRLTLEKNPLYYGADAVQIERVECTTADETSTALAFYENEELDAVYLPSQFLRQTFGRYTPDPVFSRQLYSAPRPGTSYLVFNTHKPPFDDAHVRRAFSYAVDRETLVDVIVRDGSWPARTFAPPDVFGSVADDPQAGITFDPEQARQELTLAGYPKGKGFPTVQVRYGYCDQDEIAQKIAQTIAGMWGDHLGVNVEIVCQNPWARIVGCPDVAALPHVELSQWVADIPDQHGFVYERFVLEPVWSRKTQCDLWLLADESQMQGFKQRLTAAGEEPDSFRRQALYREAEQLLCVDLCAVAPLFHASQVWLTKPYLHRDYPVIGGQNFKDWRIDPH